MRIVVWNCFRGDPSKRLEELSAIRPDVVVLPESRAPEKESDRLVWSGRAGELGTAVLTTVSYRVVRAPLVPDASPSATPFQIRGPVSFNLLAVWTFKEPTYAHGLSRVIDAYEPFIRSGPTVVAGDFNGNAIWDKDNKKVNYSVNARRLEADCGLKSAYHVRTGEAPGTETQPTHYFRWKREQSFHIDYCFVPESWVVASVEVGGFEHFTTSDHRPLAVTLVIPAGSAEGVA